MKFRDNWRNYFVTFVAEKAWGEGVIYMGGDVGRKLYGMSRLFEVYPAIYATKLQNISQLSSNLIKIYLKNEIYLCIFVL